MSIAAQKDWPAGIEAAETPATARLSLVPAAGSAPEGAPSNTVVDSAVDSADEAFVLVEPMYYI